VDVASRDLFWQIIQDEADAGRTVFATTHFLEEVDYCDHVSFIADGRLVANATPEELRAANSDGYRIDVDAPLAGEALARLATAGFTVTHSGDALTLRRPQIDAASLDALAAALGPAAVGGLRIEQPAMNDVFTRIIERTRASAP